MDLFNNFNKLLERTDVAVGHVCPKYALEHLDSEMIEKAMNKYKYVGTLLDYIEHQEKVETESLEISFTQFKEMVKNKIE